MVFRLGLELCECTIRERPNHEWNSKILNSKVFTGHQEKDKRRGFIDSKIHRNPIG